jgi:cephalosporin hydroxylase
MVSINRHVRTFLFEWAVNPAGVFQNKWFGVPTVQNPLDVWVTQEIMYEVEPDFVVEAGTLEGGSAALWAMLLEHINPEGRVITIDIRDQVTAAKDLPVVQRRVDFLIGSSTDPRIVADVAKRVAGGKVMVILDSLHTEEHVLAELEAYSPLVSVGSYLIVQDTGMMAGVRYVRRQFDQYPGGGRAIETFLATNDNFEIDESRERWILTFNGNGFLKRVR